MVAIGLTGRFSVRAGSYQPPAFRWIRLCRAHPPLGHSSSRCTSFPSPCGMVSGFPLTSESFSNACASSRRSFKVTRLPGHGPKTTECQKSDASRRGGCRGCLERHCFAPPSHGDGLRYNEKGHRPGRADQPPGGVEATEEGASTPVSVLLDRTTHRPLPC